MLLVLKYLQKITNKHDFSGTKYAPVALKLNLPEKSHKLWIKSFFDHVFAIPDDAKDPPSHGSTKGSQVHVVSPGNPGGQCGWP
jgi:hypothetical protein